MSVLGDYFYSTENWAYILGRGRIKGDFQVVFNENSIEFLYYTTICGAGLASNVKVFQYLTALQGNVEDSPAWF